MNMSITFVNDHGVVLPLIQILVLAFMTAPMLLMPQMVRHYHVHGHAETGKLQNRSAV